MFNINVDRTRQGFHITFNNGWTVSVQCGREGNTHAETACWFEDGPTGEVKTYCSPEQVAEIILEVSQRVRSDYPC